MKFSSVFAVLGAILFGSLLLDVSAAPRNVMFLQQRPMIQRAMLVHFKQPKYSMRRSSQEVTAFAAGDSVEGSTCIHDKPHHADAAPLVADVTSAENEVDAETVNGEQFPEETVESATVLPEEPAEPEDNDNNEEEEEVSPFVPTDEKVSSRHRPHTFFPMNFGSTFGGSIAVADSLSTGKGGAASHAFAYGGAKKVRTI